MIEGALERVRGWLHAYQERLAAALEARETAGRFVNHDWQREGFGSGRTKVLEGAIFERGGVSFSDISGASLPAAASQRQPHIADQPFTAMGVSVVLHPYNPYVPTSHCNLRLFCTRPLNDSEVPLWWFGGGFDLTPCYAYDEDVLHWHRTAYNACAPFGDAVYREYKAWCDRYFYLPHRAEPRGIGGLFFDDLNAWGFARCFDFIRAVGDAYMEAYLPIVDRRCGQPYGERQRAFQCYRRGRYVEFNLLHDRGTLFGLKAGGRSESILMSMPPVVHWRYAWHPSPGSAEAKLYERFLQPHEFDFAD